MARIRTGLASAFALVCAWISVGWAGELQRSDLERFFPPPYILGEKDDVLPIWPIFKQNGTAAWIPERSATRLREADLNVLSKLGKQGLEWRLEPEAFTRREVGREDDLLDFLVGCPVDIEVARQPST